MSDQMHKKRGITLIGMPGAEKSTIGRMLAEKLDMRFLDLDDVMREKTGKSPSEFLRENGDEEFIRQEGLLADGCDLGNTVFSPGGSIVYATAAMGKIKQATMVVYLRLPLSAIHDRLSGAAADRGIVGFGEKGLEALFQERTKLYEQFADMTVDCENREARDMVEMIMRLA
ncbi:MAG: shikimate kinase [Patescibacteria group bacterium]|nr:shikimate kinase [Patescibacteria group bacterium]